MDVTNLDEDVEMESPTLTLEEASAIVHDGMELLDCVDSIYHVLDEGRMKVEAETGSFYVKVSLDDPDGSHSVANEHGGHWGEHPEFPAADWRLEVENNETRLGYWDWALDKARQASYEKGSA